MHTLTHIEYKHFFLHVQDATTATMLLLFIARSVFSMRRKAIRESVT